MPRTYSSIPTGWSAKLKDIGELRAEIEEISDNIKTLRTNPTGHQWTEWTLPPSEVGPEKQFPPEVWAAMTSAQKRALWAAAFDKEYLRRSYVATPQWPGSRNLRLANKLDKELKRLNKMLKTREDMFYKMQQDKFGIEEDGGVEYYDILDQINRDIDDNVENARQAKMYADLPSEDEMEWDG